MQRAWAKKELDISEEGQHGCNWIHNGEERVDGGDLDKYTIHELGKP